MKVLIIETDDVVEVNDSYAARLIEQGKAILYVAPVPKRSAKAEKAASTEVTEDGKGE